MLHHTQQSYHTIRKAWALQKRWRTRGCWGGSCRWVAGINASITKWVSARWAMAYDNICISFKQKLAHITSMTAAIPHDRYHQQNCSMSGQSSTTFGWDWFPLVRIKVTLYMVRLTLSLIHIAIPCGLPVIMNGSGAQKKCSRQARRKKKWNISPPGCTCV